jgi:hypothetical protein
MNTHISVLLLADLRVYTHICIIFLIQCDAILYAYPVPPSHVTMQ